MFKRSTSTRTVRRLAAGALGIAVLFGGGTLPVLGAEPTDSPVVEQVPAIDPIGPELTVEPDPTPVPGETASDEVLPEPAEAPAETTEPAVTPSPEPDPSDPVTPTTEPDQGIETGPAVPKDAGPRVSAALTATTYHLTVTADPAVSCVGSSSELLVTVSPVPAIGAPVEVYHDGMYMSAGNTDEYGEASIWTDGLTLGTNTFSVEFTGPYGSDPVARASTTIEARPSCSGLDLTTDRGTAVTGTTLVRLTASIYGTYVTGGSVTFTDDYDGSKAIGTVDMTENADGYQSATLSVRLDGLGTHVLSAVYTGDWDGPFTSETVTIEVTNDTGVEASGVGVSSTTFYPYKDNYRDTVAIRGTLQEPASVTIKIYSSTGRKVRSFSVSNRQGGYSVAWTGRTASGTRVAAGKYRVVQTIRDLTGHARTFTAYTNVSNKRLYWYTGSITKYGNQYSTYDYSTFGWVTSSYRYSRGVNLYGNIYEGYAYTGYSFLLPAATKYGSISFKVLGKPMSGYGVPYISVWNYKNGYEDGERWVGRSEAWYSTSVSGSSHVSSSRHVRGYVTTLGDNRGFYDVSKVRITFKYAKLR